MKRKIIITILLIALIFSKAMTVFADVVGTDFAFSVQGFELRVYQLTREKNEKNEYEFTKESYKKYLNDQYVKTIPIPAADISFAPSYHEATIAGAEFTIIDLGVNITENKLKELLSTEMAAVTETNIYEVELVVDYIMDTAPATHNKYTTSNLLKRYKSAMYAAENGELDIDEFDASYFETPTSLGQLNAQVINDFLIDTTHVYYTRDAAQTDETTAFSYFHFANSDNANDYEMVMFTNVDNPETLAEKIDTEMARINGENDEETEAREEVEVEDTSMDLSKGIVIAGMLSILLGAGAVFYIVTKQQTRQERE